MAIKTVSSDAGDSPDYSTVSAAISGATDGDEIEIFDGVSNGVYAEGLAFSGVNKALTFRPHEESEYDITLRAGGSTFPFLTGDNNIDKTLTFTDITFDGSNTTRDRVIYSLGRRDLVFTDCTVISGTSTKSCLLAANGTNTEDRIITLTNCIMTENGNAGENVIRMDDGSIVINGGTYTHLNIANVMIWLLDNLVDVEITDVAFVGNRKGIGVQPNATLASFVFNRNTFNGLNTVAVDLDNIVTLIDISDNVITNDGTNDATNIGIDLQDLDGQNNTFLKMTNNTITGVTTGIFAKVVGIDYLEVNNNTIICSGDQSQGGLMLGVNANYYDSYTDADATILGSIYNNVVIMNSMDTHCCLLGQGYNRLVVENNYFEGGDFCLVLKGRYNTYIGNVVYGNYGVYFVGGQYSVFEHNTVYATDINHPDFNSAFRIAQNTDTSPQRPIGNIVRKNIFHAGDSPYAFRLDQAAGNTEHYNTIMDYNCFYGGSSGLINMDGATKTLAEAQVLWNDPTAWNSTLYFLNNAANSINVDPLFVNPVDGNFRLKSTSACLNTGQPTVNEGVTSFGTWQARQYPNLNNYLNRGR